MSGKVTIELKQPNFTIVNVGSLKLYFSYETIIAFQAPGQSTPIACENRWGPTTGKHLGQVPVDKDDRLPEAQFKKELEHYINKLGLK